MDTPRAIYFDGTRSCSHRGLCCYRPLQHSTLQTSLVTFLHLFVSWVFIVWVDNESIHFYQHSRSPFRADIEVRYVGVPRGKGRDIFYIHWAFKLSSFSFFPFFWHNRSADQLVSLSGFAYLFSEVVQYHQNRVDSISELERRLEATGYGVGLRVLELLAYRSREYKRETKLMNVLQFVSTMVWKSLFGKAADSLERSIDHTDEFMIIDYNPITRYVPVESWNEWRTAMDLLVMMLIKIVEAYLCYFFYSTG